MAVINMAMVDSIPLMKSEEDEEKGVFEKYIRPCLCEFVGVTLFVFVGTSSILSTSLVGAALAHGLMIAIMVANFGEISGGHFNPAVTLGVTLAGGINPSLAALYVPSQLVASILGSAITKGIMPSEAYKNINGGGQTLGESVTAGMGVLCEITLTVVLVLTVLMSAVDKKNKHGLAPLVIGFSVAADILAGGMISGASMNPARSFGPAVVFSSVGDIWTYHYVYWVGPAIGALIAGCLFRFVLGSNQHRLKPWNSVRCAGFSPNNQHQPIS